MKLPARKGYVVYWLLYLVSAVISLAGGVSTWAQHLLVAIGAVAWRFRQPLRRRLDRWLPGSGFWRYMGAGLLYSAFLEESLGVGLEGDLHPNLLISSFLWLGCFAGVLAAWWLLARRWQWRAGEIFMLTGLFGVIVEQTFLLPRLLFSERWAEALLIAPYIHAVYAATFAPPVLIAGPGLADDLGEATPRPNLRVIALALVLTIALFFLGGLWIVLWSPLFAQPASGR